MEGVFAHGTYSGSLQNGVSRRTRAVLYQGDCWAREELSPSLIARRCFITDKKFLRHSHLIMLLFHRSAARDRLDMSTVVATALRLRYSLNV